MISPRPWRYERKLCESGDFERWFDGYVSGYGVWHCVKDMDAEDIRAACAAMNAFNDAGIEPADLPKLVEAVRAFRAAVLADALIPITRASLNWIEVSELIAVAAACLPENRLEVKRETRQDE